MKPPEPRCDDTTIVPAVTRDGIKQDLARLEEKWQVALANKGDANSATCPREWRQFVALAKQKKLPAGMSSQYQTSRLVLFNLFLTCDCNVDRCEATIERKTIDRKNAKRGWTYVKADELFQKPYFYTKEEADDIIAIQTAKGRYLDDEFFKDKIDKRSYLVREKTSFESENIQEESLTARGTMNADAAMLQCLAGPDGIMQPGGMPDIPGLSVSTMASFAVENFDGVAPRKAAPKKKSAKTTVDPGDPSAVAVTESPLQHGRALEQEYLKEASEAQQFAIQIKAYHLSSEVAEFMQEHHKRMTNLYHKLHELVAQNCEDMEEYRRKVYRFAGPRRIKYRVKVETAKALVRTIKKGAKQIAAGESKGEGL